jgi:hypothetical protein
LVLFLAFAVVLLGGTNFSELTTIKFPPIKELPCYDEYKMFDENFPSYLTRNIEVVYIKNFRGNSVVSNVTEQLCEELQAKFEAVNSPVVESMESYYTYVNTSLDLLKLEFVSVNQTGMVFVVHMNTFGSSAKPDNDFIATAIEITSNLNDKYLEHGVSAVFTGQLTTLYIAEQKATQSFLLIDSSGLPFIFLMFWYQV